MNPNPQVPAFLQHLLPPTPIPTEDGCKLIDPGDMIGAAVVHFILAGLSVAVFAVLSAAFMLCGGFPWWTILLFAIPALLGFGYSIRNGLKEYRVVSQMEPGELHLEGWPFRLGEEIHLKYVRRLKRPLTLNKLSAKVALVEKATYQQGSSTTTVQEIVREWSLMAMEPQRPFEEVVGEWDFVVPEDQPPTLPINRNELIWKVIVTVSFAEGLQDDSEFPLLVLPEVLDFGS